MILRILKNDIQRNVKISIVVFLFITLSALLVATGSHLITDTVSALNLLFSRAKAPHYVQMHAGEIDRQKIEHWAEGNDMVNAYQIVEMISVDGSTFYLEGSKTAEENSIMDIGFVTQNQEFDYLLDLGNNIAHVSPGEIAVPIYYKQKDNLKVGDSIRIQTGHFKQSFRVAGFIRDAQMNPAIVHSKRFLVHEKDHGKLKKHIPGTEYLIEFRLNDPGKIGRFSSEYQSAGLPQKGTAVDHKLFKTLNGLSDGIIAGVVIVLSLLLMIIAILCLRFIILATLEEDTREIGVMKAIGIRKEDIRRIYLAKYVVMAGLASVLGYLVSLMVMQGMSGRLNLYLGEGTDGLLHQLVPIVASASLSLVVVLSCLIVLRRLSEISAVEALHSMHPGETANNLPLPKLNRTRYLDINVTLGFRDVLQRFKTYALLGFVFFFCTFVITVPVHFLTTIQSPSFISYLGIGRSDIRIDLRQSDNMTGRFKQMVTYLENDPDVDRFSPLVTAPYTMIGTDGTKETIDIETGDFSIFPLDFLRGDAPQTETDIALSSLNAQEMDKEIGDPLVLWVEGEKRIMTVSGIYQDVTHGGRTAKANLPYKTEEALWYTVSLDVKPEQDIDRKIQEYSEEFQPARVTDLETYLDQTLGSTIKQLKIAALAAGGVGLSVAALITSLFLNMLINKDAAQIGVLRSLGFTLRAIRIQYVSRSLLLLGVGILTGTIFSNTVGQRLISLLWSFMGASRISFVINPFRAYVLLPLLLLLTVSLTTAVTLQGIRENNIAALLKT